MILRTARSLEMTRPSGARDVYKRQPLVSPDILGASQGAAFGAAVAILAGFTAGMVSVSAFAFALLTVLLVLLISARAKGNHMMVVVLAGVMVSSLFQAGVSYAKLIACLLYTSRCV